MTLADGSDEDVVEAIVIVVADGDAQSEERNMRGPILRSRR